MQVFTVVTPYISGVGYRLFVVYARGTRGSTRYFRGGRADPFSFPRINFYYLTFFQSLLPPIQPPLLGSPPTSCGAHGRPTVQVLFRPRELQVQAFPPPFFPNREGYQTRQCGATVRPFSKFYPRSSNNGCDDHTTRGYCMPASSVPCARPRDPSTR